jgi:esterase/lipase
MRKLFSRLIILVTTVVLISCSSKKETASSIAQKWCELNGKMYKAEGDAKEAAKAALKTYESELQKKYEKDEAFMKEIGKEVEKCEDASEGK